MSPPPSGQFAGRPPRHWLLALLALAIASAWALAIVAVVAWQAAERQRSDGAGALRQAATESAALKAAELEAALHTARNPDKNSFSRLPLPVIWPHPPVARAWFIRAGSPGDWIFGPWPQPESRAARSFAEATTLAHAGRKDEALKILQPLLAGDQDGDESVTASGLPLRPLALRLAITLQPAASRRYAHELVKAAARQPSPLSMPLLEEAVAAMPLPTEWETVSSAVFRSLISENEKLRTALREKRDDVAGGLPWITNGRGKRWHLHYGPDSIQALPAAVFLSIATEAGLDRGHHPALPSGWKFRARLDGMNFVKPDDPALTAMASFTRGPLVVEAVAPSRTAFAALDAQLTRQRWLIAGATAFITAAATAFVLVLARQRRLNAMMANFVAAVSHELRAPVGSMGLLAERLSDGRAGSNGDHAHYHRLIRDECRRLSATIGNVLTFSRRQRGLTTFEPELSDLSALLHDTIALMRPLADERSLILSTDFPDKPVERELDPVLIRQAVLNLLDNAIKFSPPGGTVRLRLRESAADGFATITVRDEGPGIPPSERTRIFKPFYRTGSELRRETPGIGIGLAIVQAAATAHHGTATANPAPGQGTEFTLRLGLIPPT